MATMGHAAPAEAISGTAAMTATPATVTVLGLTPARTNGVAHV